MGLEFNTSVAIYWQIVGTFSISGEFLCSKVTFLKKKILTSIYPLKKMLLGANKVIGRDIKT